MENWIEPQRRLPIVADTDVIVVGSGVSGLFAALAAAQQGARTLLVDRFGMPGGNLGPGMIVGGSLYSEADLFYDRDGVTISREKLELPSVPRDFVSRVQRLRATNDANNYAEDASIASYVALKMMEEAGVDLLLSTYASSPILEGSRVCGLIVENHSGRQAIRARVVIDATGEARIAERAGAPVVRSVPANPKWAPTMRGIRMDENLPLCNSVGVYLVINGVEWDRFDAFRADAPCSSDDAQWAEETLGFRVGDHHGDFLAPIWHRLWQEGQQEAVQRLLYPDVGGKDVGHVNFPLEPPRKLSSRVAGARTCFNRAIDSADGTQMSALEASIRKYVFESVEFYRRYVPGFEEAYILCVSPYLGSRGGPFIHGQYTVTIEDIQRGARFEDVVLVHYRHALFRTGAAEGCDLPYRMLLPKQVGGLMATGTSAAYIRRGHDPAIRCRYTMYALGQATGTAAAMAAVAGMDPGEIDVHSLQRTLMAEGFYLGDATRLAELGLG